MVIFHSYVSLPEGNKHDKGDPYNTNHQPDKDHIPGRPL